MYCQKVVGDHGFSIDEWNANFDICIKLNLNEDQMSRILDDPDPIMCEKQCLACAEIVMNRRIKTKHYPNPCRPVGGEMEKI